MRQPCEINASIINSVEPAQHGLASGVYLTLQHVAFSLGFAVLSAVIATYDSKHLAQFLKTSVDYNGITLHQVSLLLAGKNTIQQLNPQQLASLKQSEIEIYTHAFSYGMGVLGIFALIACVFTFAFVRKTEKF